MYRCNHCDSIFRNKHYIRSYEYVNGHYQSVEKPLKCDFCNKLIPTNNYKKNIKETLVEQVDIETMYEKDVQIIEEYKKNLSFLETLGNTDALRFLSSTEIYGTYYLQIRNGTYAPVMLRDILYINYYEIDLPTKATIKCSVSNWSISFPGITDMLENYEEEWLIRYREFNADPYYADEEEEVSEEDMIDVLEE